MAIPWCLPLRAGSSPMLSGLLSAAVLLMTSGLLTDSARGVFLTLLADSDPARHHMSSHHLVPLGMFRAAGTLALGSGPSEDVRAQTEVN